MTSNEDVIRVDEISFDEGIPLKQLYKPAKKWARSRLQGKKVVNGDTGRTIEITGNGIDHTISSAYNLDVIHSMAVLPEMIERSKFVRSEPPHPPKEGKMPEQNLLAVERYETKVQIREKLYTAELIVKVEKRNDRKVGRVDLVRLYYHHNLHGNAKGRQS